MRRYLFEEVAAFFVKRRHLYQWGRKDAFPGADGSTIQQSDNPNASTIKIYSSKGEELSEDGTGYCKIDIITSRVLNGYNTQVYAIKNPLSFIYNTASPWDWYTNNVIYQNDDLWGDGNKKSNYDPCPKGWRIPTDAEITWGDFSTTSAPHYNEGMLSSSGNKSALNGRLYNQLAWYPSSGTRYATSGVLYYVGLNAAFWSSSINEINAVKRLYYQMTNISPNSTSSRGYSVSVRCVQE